MLIINITWFIASRIGMLCLEPIFRRSKRLRILENSKLRLNLIKPDEYVNNSEYDLFGTDSILGKGTPPVHTRTLWTWDNG